MPRASDDKWIRSADGKMCPRIFQSANPPTNTIQGSSFTKAELHMSRHQAPAAAPKLQQDQGNLRSPRRLHFHLPGQDCQHKRTPTPGFFRPPCVIRRRPVGPSTATRPRPRGKGPPEPRSVSRLHANCPTTSQACPIFQEHHSFSSC